MNIQLCQLCNKEKEKIFFKIYRGVSIYTDSLGHRWYGKRCPDCYKEYKLEYDAKRRLSKGHKPLGSEVTCTRCGNPHLLENGSSMICKGCRGKK